MKLMTERKYQCPESPFSLDRINNLLKSKIRGVIHIGANYGEETNEYRRREISKVIWIEPLSSGFEQLKALREAYGDLIYNYCIGAENKEIDFFVTNNIVSSSPRDLGLHKHQDPTCVVQEIQKVNMKRLDTLVEEEGINLSDYNFINVDVQGFEDEVIEGGKETFKKMDAILLETNYKDVYLGCKSKEEIQSIMADLGFVLVSSIQINKVQFEDVYVNASSFK